MIRVLADLRIHLQLRSRGGVALAASEAIPESTTQKEMMEEAGVAAPAAAAGVSARCSCKGPSTFNSPRRDLHLAACIKNSPIGHPSRNCSASAYSERIF
ncbi:hypothetical protein OsI_00487 [Oryza sativa Indica Group]|uniref:Uncharacterized protein n=1 Tax=Oryza sativa subsp. indica TaxID=39946 RepID=B8ADD4_ORYSI|nr:hypothetical protein OsI_00487 [Oryza sativa Indica Group]